MTTTHENDNYDIEQERIKFQKELGAAMIKAGAGEVELDAPAAPERGEHEHSPLPWEWLPDEGQFVVDAKGNIVAEIPCQGCNPADGSYIVNCVNRHSTLVAQREQLLRAAQFALSTPGMIRGRDSLQRIVDEVLTNIEQERTRER